MSTPIRAAFYYPWFPENWTDSGVTPATRYQPFEGIYDSGDFALIRAHISAMEYAKITGATASWWGTGSKTDQRFPQLLNAAHGTSVAFCPYYEPAIPITGGQIDTAQLKADLTHIYLDYAADASYLKGPDGRPAIFVYGRAIAGWPKLQAFMQANANRFYVSVQAQPTPITYPAFAAQPHLEADSWHQYNPSVSNARVPGYSYTISPGFWKFNEANPRLMRDPAIWQQSIANMLASGEQWQLITTFNEWGEGSAIENAMDWQSITGQGVYLDALTFA